MADKNNAAKAVVLETPEQMLARVMAENAALKAQVANQRPTGGAFRMAVSVARAPGTNGPTDKGAKGGALSVYGVGRFGVHLYREQWEKIFDHVDEMKAFIAANADKLSTKAE